MAGSSVLQNPVPPAVGSFLLRKGKGKRLDRYEIRAVVDVQVDPVYGWSYYIVARYKEGRRMRYTLIDSFELGTGLYIPESS